MGKGLFIFSPQLLVAAKNRGNLQWARGGPRSFAELNVAAEGMWKTLVSCVTRELAVLGQRAPKSMFWRAYRLAGDYVGFYVEPKSGRNESFMDDLFVWLCDHSISLSDGEPPHEALDFHRVRISVMRVSKRDAKNMVLGSDGQRHATTRIADAMMPKHELPRSTFPVSGEHFLVATECSMVAWSVNADGEKVVLIARSLLEGDSGHYALPGCTDFFDVANCGGSLVHCTVREFIQHTYSAYSSELLRDIAARPSTIGTDRFDVPLRDATATRLRFPPTFFVRVPFVSNELLKVAMELNSSRDLRECFSKNLLQRPLNDFAWYSVRRLRADIAAMDGVTENVASTIIDAERLSAVKGKKAAWKSSVVRTFSAQRSDLIDHMDLLLAQE